MHTQLARQALAAALELHTANNRNLEDPICVYDVAAERDVDVWFLDIGSLEGVYSQTSRPTILIGSERPAGRRAFTCAHELGHHIFGHGTKVDQIQDQSDQTAAFDPDEYLVQTFAGFFLMPKLAVSHAFSERGWKPATATAEQIYRISSLFGVSYTGLIHHMSKVLGLLNTSDADVLAKVKLRDLRAKFLEDPKRSLVFVDAHWKGRAVDVEVGDQVLAPVTVECEGSSLRIVSEGPLGRLFDVITPGRGRLVDSVSGWASFTRASKINYSGRSAYRHLEDIADE